MSLAPFLQTQTDQIRALYKAYTTAAWEAAITGTPEANQRETDAQAAYMRYFADPALYAETKRLLESGLADPWQARQVKLLYLDAAQNQQDEATIQKLTQLEAAVRGQYYNFRPEVRGQRMSDNELDNLLAQSADSDLAREAWEASKQIGAQVAEPVRALARVRNAAAQKQGFRDFFHRSLTLSEIDESQLLQLFADLETATEAPFTRLKADIDAARAAHFGLPVSDLRPWHYGDRFFQDPPEMGAVNMDALFATQDAVALSTATYDGLGLDVRDILARSDLYARAGKNQHAFCTDIDREGDVRTLNNLENNHRWNETLLHELGHAIYDKFHDKQLPWLLRTTAHTLSTEAIAILMGSLTYDAEWLEQIVGVPAAEAQRVAAAARQRERAVRLIFTRWVLVLTNFERLMYADPERDLDTLWWDLVERYQKLARPANRRNPDWAAKIHVALYPVYYQNYELGHLITAQLQAVLRRVAGGLVNRPAAGRWLVEKFFAPGATVDWATHVALATGEPLNTRYFVESVQ
jgi:peptidyl-dipeptidase A